MEALQKAQQIRLQESKGTPFFKEANGKSVQRPTGRKYWVSLLIGGLGILLFISFGGSALLPRFPSPEEQKMASANKKESVLPPGNISEIHEPYRKEIPRQKIKPPGQLPKNPSTPLQAEITPPTSATPTSAQAIVDPQSEGPLPLISPLMGEEKEEVPMGRTAEKTKELKIDGEKEFSTAREVLTHFNRGVHFSQQGDLARAIQAYEKVIELEPNYVEAYNNLAIVYQEMGDWENARLTYQKSIELNPRYEKAHNNLGILLCLQERYEESIEAFQKALVINPRNLESYINLGILYKKTAQMDKAVACYQKALHINPLHPEAHYNIALLHEQLGNWALAIGHYQQFIHLSAENRSDLVSMVKRHLDDLSRAVREMNRGKGPGNG